MRKAGWFILIAILPGLLAGGCGDRRGAGRVVVAPPDTGGVDLPALATMLEDPQQDPSQKVATVRALLEGPYTTAQQFLGRMLENSQDLPARLAVAQAVQLSPCDQAELLAGLNRMLCDDQAVLAQAAAEALVAVDSPVARTYLQEAASDPQILTTARVTAIAALARLADCRAAGWLIDLLEDDDPYVRQQAAAELARMTGIRDFGQNAERWRSWLAGAGRDEVRWLNEQVRLLGQSNTELDLQLQQTRAVLTRLANDLYDAASAEQRPSLVTGYLADPLCDLRVAGLRLIERRLASNEPVTPELTGAAMLLLADPAQPVRAGAALLAGALAGEDVLGALLARLEVEPETVVREALLRSLGQLRQAQALPAVVAQVGGEDELVATAAASALASIATRNHLEPALKDQAVDVLIARCSQPSQRVELREATLIALGVLADSRAEPLLLDALNDASARVRLAGINGLAALGRADLAGPMVPLAGDPDRGVRQAVIAAMGALDPQQHLSVILDRTRSDIEPDAAVRQQAWDVVMVSLEGAPDSQLVEIIEQLQQRDDCLDQRIDLLGMLVRHQGADAVPARIDAQRRLAAALLEAGRPAEAAAVLGEAYEQDPDPIVEKDPLLLEWVSALLAADDPAVVTAIADYADGACLDRTLELLELRMAELDSRQRYELLVPLCRESLLRLPGLMGHEQLERFQGRAASAQQHLEQQDLQQVEQLALQLCAEDLPTRALAREQLVRMAGRATNPLLSRLRQTITAPEAAGPQEKALVEVLEQIDPRLGDYDISGPLADKLKLIDSLLVVSAQP